MLKHWRVNVPAGRLLEDDAAVHLVHLGSRAHPFVLLLAHVAVQRDDARLGLDVDADELMDPEPDDPGTGQHGRTGDAPKRVVLLSATVNSTKKESERVCTRIPMCMARPRQRVTSCTFVALKSRRGEVPRNACTWLVL